MSPYQFLCKLAKGNEILDENATCSIYSIERQTPFSQNIMGEGEIQTLNYLFSVNDLDEHDFHLIFDSAITIEAGKIENIPIEITELGQFGRTRAKFKIKKI